MHILIHHQPLPPSAPPSAQPTAITMRPHTRQAALSLGLALVGVTTDTTCRTVATRTQAIAWAKGVLMGVALSFPAEMENQFLAFAAPF